MRLSKTAWLILGIGIFVIAFGSLYMVYSRQSGEREQLNNSLLVAQATLPKVVSEKEDWESQLSQLESQLTSLESELAQATSLLDSTEASFQEPVESIESDEELFKIAGYWDLEIISLTAEEPTDEVVDNITYSITPFTVDVEGEVADILDFISTITTDEYFIAATVELVSIVVPEPLTEKDKEGLTEGEMPSATIKLVIYGYKGE